MRSNDRKPAVKLRINASGYGGKPCSLFAAFDPATDVLLIAREAAAYEPGEREGFLKITNNPHDTHFDELVTEDDFRDAILAFFALDAQKLVSLGKGTERCNPASKIEQGEVKEDGMTYRISADVTNAQVAVLLAALTANRQRGAGAAFDMLDDLLTI